jgi:hypothetical protein
MAGLGELVRPDHYFWTTAENRSWLNQINAAFASLGQDIASHRPAILAAAGGQRFIDDFTALKDRWLRYNHTANTLGRIGSLGTDQEYIDGYNALEIRYTALVGAAPTVAFVPPSGPGALETANRNLMIWSVIGIVGVIGAGYLLSNYAKVKTLSKLSFNRHRRRRNRR